MRSYLIALFFVLSASAGLLLAADETDIITWTPDGKNYKDDAAEIISETLFEIKFRIKGGGEKGVPLNAVQRIAYKNEPPDLIKGKQLMDQGQYDKAIEAFQKALGDPKLRGIFKQHLIYYTALCYQYLRKFDDAVSQYDRLLKEVQQSRYFREAHTGKIKSFLGKSDIPGALAASDQAKNQARDLKEDRFGFEIDLMAGRILEDNNQSPKALQRYNDVRTGALAKYAMLAHRAIVGLGRCALADEKYDEAERFFKEVADTSNDDVALAGAYNGKGDCYRLKAEKGKIQDPAQAYKTALKDCYLRAKVMYPPPEGEPTYEYQKSIFYSGQCYERLAEYAPSAEKKTIYLTTAKSLYQELKDNFPDSSFKIK